MKERPILFNAPMVRAILEGRKSQTRRVVKPQPIYVCPKGPAGVPLLSSKPNFTDENIIRCPYGVPGDRLWVRETWTHHVHAQAAERDEDGPFVYAATDSAQHRLDERWRSSIHMPRWASRILLEVTAVRVERLQDISDADAQAEGVGWSDYQDQHGERMEPREAFAALWEQINGPGSWEANPWVWVVEFRRVEP